MPIPKLDDFFSDPKHKEQRDFLSGVVDARLKEIIAERLKERESAAPKDKQKKGDAGSFFDEIFGGGDE